jgi:hypothetical protein
MGVQAAALSLPDDPALAAAAAALEERGFAGEVWDAGWRLVFVSGEARKLSSIRPEVSSAELGTHFLSPEMMAARETWPTGPTFESLRESLRSWGGFIAATTAGGVDALRAVADPRLSVVLDEMTPQPPPAAWTTEVDVRFGDETFGNDVLIVAIRSDGGDLAGFLVIIKPAVRAAVLGMLALGDARLFEQMSGILEPARRPSAILFADLENSTALSRQL